MSQVQNESQDEQPLNPVVRVLNPLWQDAVTRLQREDAYKKLVKGYAGANPINLFAITADQERDFCRTLIKGAFRVIGLNHREYKDCYTACIDKCVRTHVVRATTWLDWDGHRDFCVRLKQAVELTNDTKKKHILDAPSTIAAIVVKQLRNVDTIGNDNIAAALMRYRFFQFAHRSVQLYAQTKAPIILTNLPFKGTAMSLEAPSSAEARHHVELNDVSTMMEIQDIDEDPTRNMAQLMLECQQFDLQGSKPRTPSPPPEMQLLRNKIITREGALQTVGGLINQSHTQGWSSDLNVQLSGALTEGIVKVLPADMKSYLDVWAPMAGQQDVKRWVQEAGEDLTRYQSLTVQKIPGPPRWSSNGPAETFIDDLELLAAAEHKLPDAIRRKIRTIGYQMRYYIRHMEPLMLMRAKAEAMSSLKEVTESAKTSLTSTIQAGFRKLDTNKRVRFEDDEARRNVPTTADRGTQRND